jgi:glutathione S-transferase
MEEMVAIANGVLPPFRDWFYAEADGDPGDAEAVRRLARRRIEQAWQRLDDRLADGRPYLLGAELSTADLLATMLMRWARDMPKPATSWPRLHDYVVRMRARAAYLELHRVEGLTGWTNSDDQAG